MYLKVIKIQGENETVKGNPIHSWNYQIRKEKNTSIVWGLEGQKQTGKY